MGLVMRWLSLLMSMFPLSSIFSFPWRPPVMGASTGYEVHYEACHRSRGGHGELHSVNHSNRIDSASQSVAGGATGQGNHSGHATTGAQELDLLSSMISPTKGKIK